MVNKLPGNIKVRISDNINRNIIKGREQSYAIVENIKKIDEVTDVWFTDGKEWDLLVEVEVNKYEDGQNIVSRVNNIKGVTDAHAYIAIPAY